MRGSSPFTVSGTLRTFPKQPAFPKHLRGFQQLLRFQIPTPTRPTYLSQAAIPLAEMADEVTQLLEVALKQAGSAENAVAMIRQMARLAHLRYGAEICQDKHVSELLADGFLDWAGEGLDVGGVGGSEDGDKEEEDIGDAEEGRDD